MMDLSDGLGTDLPRLAAASGLGFRVQEELLPVRQGFTAAQAVADGEDYELLMTFPPRRREEILRLASERFPETPLTVIGEMTPGTFLIPPRRIQAFPITGCSGKTGGRKKPKKGPEKSYSAGWPLSCSCWM